MRKTLLILGPTASGKSALALALARRFGAEIVNADAQQVYADLRVLSARPTPEEEAVAPHHLFGCIDAARRYSVGAWLEDATAVLGAIAARGRPAIVIGGTGLYFRALTEGLAEIPPPPPGLRESLHARLAAEGREALHAALAAVDPEGAATLAPNDSVRVLRALEVVEATGAPIAAWRERQGAPALADYAALALTPPRDELYGRINARFDAMVVAGALEEAEALWRRGLDPLLPAMKAHGMPGFAAYFRGEITLADAIERGKRDTRRYAKRQFTWIANQTPDWTRVAATDLAARTGIAAALVAPG